MPFSKQTEAFDLEHPLIARKLDFVGLNPEAIRNLPEDFRKILASGGLTPLCYLSLKNSEGYTLNIPMKLKLVTDQNGKPNLQLYGVHDKFVNTLQLPDESLTNLKKGEIVQFSDKKGDRFLVQYDPETKNFIKVDISELRLDRRISEVEKIRDIELGTEQKKAIKEGKPVTLDIGGENVTVGVDLRSPNNFKQLKGDMEDWKLRKEWEYDKAHPEYIGIIKTDENRWEYKEFVKEMERKPQSREAKKSKGISM